MSSLLDLSPELSSLKGKLEAFVNERCIPAEVDYERHVAKFSGPDRWSHAAVPPVIERLKSEARALGLWNLFLPHPVPDHLTSTEDDDGASSTMTPSAYLTNRE